ncbi:hypothetical protein [Brevibacillus borstelensis]|uniref:hypothetical protein n=1 Tax=Brevibacillus borstelensis TaxID=45462 RepID=UPI000469E7A7|nr:hypothetical protein [Brevibacillus borstelensis]MCC0567100.1 hypothetical protein [Brevibacillus borstelensis]MCM3473512.1 hypothetical protein [Brevibacillus borstelensis]MCM3561460.1 hypothetical protein [Brevibacillus borstelensis]MCM3593597.1 hypothetical protein [Brevibacillus borstelensis]MED1850038.1 hypothetical protein [Brevibacillus borstelensis]
MGYRSKYDWLVQIINFFRKNPVYWIAVILGAAISYYCYIKIQQLPQPSTWIELVKFYFTNTSGYLVTMLYTLVNFVYVALVGVATIFNAISFKEEYYLWVVIVTWIFGLGITIGSLYFFAVAIELIVVLITIGVLAIAASYVLTDNRR